MSQNGAVGIGVVEGLPIMMTVARYVMFLILTDTIFIVLGVAPHRVLAGESTIQPYRPYLYRVVPTTAG